MTPFLEFRERFHHLLSTMNEYFVNRLGITELRHDLASVEKHVSYPNYFHFLTIAANYRTSYMLSSDNLTPPFPIYFMDNVNHELKTVIKNLLRYKYTLSGGEEIVKNMFLDLEKWITAALYKEVHRYFELLRSKLSITVRVAGNGSVPAHEVDDAMLLFIFGPTFNKLEWTSHNWMKYVHGLFFVIAPDKHNVYIMGKHDYNEKIVNRCSSSQSTHNLVIILTQIYEFLKNIDNNIVET